MLSVTGVAVGVANLRRRSDRGNQSGKNSANYPGSQRCTGGTAGVGEGPVMTADVVLAERTLPSLLGESLDEVMVSGWVSNG